MDVAVEESIYNKLITSEDDWVNKSDLLSKVRIETKKSSSTIYKWWAKIEEDFDEKRMGGTAVYVRLKEENK